MDPIEKNKKKNLYRKQSKKKVDLPRKQKI
jgi:hypothetical protein